MKLVKDLIQHNLHLLKPIKEMFYMKQKLTTLSKVINHMYLCTTEKMVKGDH
jgi:hypothetical protein